MNPELARYFSLNGKTALVTGSSTGIGRAILFALAQAGADVIQHASAPWEGESSDAAELDAIGVRHKAIYANLKMADCERQMADQLRNFSEPDIMVLNASYQIRREFSEITDEDFDIQMYINFRSSIKLIQKFLPHMKKNSFGRIVTIGSIQQCVPHPQMAVYSASKDAQLNLVKSLAKIYAPFGITVNNVAPGTIYTRRNIDALNDEAYRERVVGNIPAGYIGEPEDCAAAVVMLCGDGGRYLTGDNIYIDGGCHLK